MTQPRRLAIASGKGGVGKTWFAITLGHALARAGRRVLLVDADLGLANVDIQLGLPPGPDLAQVLAGRLAPAAAIRAVPETGFSVLAGHSGSAALADVEGAWVEAVIAGSDAGFDDVLLDLGAGIDRATRRLAAAADHLLVLLTDEPTALTDAYAVLKLHRQDGGAAASVVVNQATSEAAGRRSHAPLAAACRHFLGFAPPLAAVIRRDERVRDAIRHQAPLLTRHPLSPAAQDVERLAIHPPVWLTTPTPS